jgi:hypothetical protein
VDVEKVKKVVSVVVEGDDEDGDDTSGNLYRSFEEANQRLQERWRKEFQNDWPRRMSVCEKVVSISQFGNTHAYYGEGSERPELGFTAALLFCQEYSGLRSLVRFTRSNLRSALPTESSG